MNIIREKTKWSLKVYQNEAKQIKRLKDVLLEILSTWITKNNGWEWFFLFVYFSLPDPKIKTEHVWAEHRTHK